MELSHLALLADQLGFSHQPIQMEALAPLPQVRSMCAADRCGRYGKSWSCPPACGSLEQLGHRMEGYRTGLLVQTIGSMADEFDLEAIEKTEALHKARFDTLARQAKALYPTCLPMASGSCTRCHKCTYPKSPCRFPNRVFPSMEAYGLWVSDICRRSGLPYSYGPKTIAFTVCILADKIEKGA